MFVRRLLSDPRIGVIAAVIVLLSLAGLNNHYRYASSGDGPARQEWQKPVVVTERPSAKSKSEIENERAERDLQAQERMAKWAFWLFWATIGGVLLLAATLRETWKAGQAAERILVQTRRQADIANDTARRQLRAYVFPTDVRIERFEGNDPIEIVVDMKNFGKTPAYRFIFIGGYAITAFPNEAPLPTIPERMDWSRGGTSGPDLYWHSTLTGIALNNAHRERLREGSAAIFVVGQITYIDVFGSRHFTRFTAVAGSETGIKTDTDSRGRRYIRTHISLGEDDNDDDMES